MYDSGVTETPDEVSPVHNHEVKEGRRYYENKWYGYRRSGHRDLRDDYYQAKAEYFAESSVVTIVEPVNPLKYILPFLTVVIGLFDYDFYRSLRQRRRGNGRSLEGCWRVGWWMSLGNRVISCCCAITCRCVKR